MSNKIAESITSGLQRMREHQVKLSICIPTFNRAAFVCSTLDSIVEQITEECEIVVSDNASTDDTQNKVEDYKRRFKNVKYIRHASNIGLDRNFNFSVEQARGEYCWLLPDDDVLRPGAVNYVLSALRNDPSLLIVNCNVKDIHLEKLLSRSCFDFRGERLYRAGEQDRLFSDMKEMTMYAGIIIIRREIWMEREREKFFGSLFIHAAVVFQRSLPGNTLLVTEPLVTYRHGNSHTFTGQVSELILHGWPSLIESLAISEACRRKARGAQPWRHPHWLLVLRGLGIYSIEEYVRWLRPRVMPTSLRVLCIITARVPGALANALLLIYYSVRPNRGGRLQMAKDSRFYIGNIFRSGS